MRSILAEAAAATNNCSLVLVDAEVTVRNDGITGVDDEDDVTGAFSEAASSLFRFSSQWDFLMGPVVV